MASKIGTVSCVLGYPAVTKVTNAGIPYSSVQFKQKFQKNPIHLCLFGFEYEFESVHDLG